HGPARHSRPRRRGYRVSEFVGNAVVTAWACALSALCSQYVWPRPPLFRCERDQTRLLDPAAPTNPELPTELQCRPLLRPTGRRTCMTRLWLVVAVAAGSSGEETNQAPDRRTQATGETPPP